MMYVKRQNFSQRGYFTQYDKRHERQHIFDDCGLYGNAITLDTIKWIDKHFKNAAPIGISFDPAQISYGGEKLVPHLLKTYPLDIHLKICKKAFRFEGAQNTWLNFEYGDVPLYTQCPLDFKGMFVGHSIKSVNRALQKGFSSKRSINIDKAQGREWDFIIVDLFGMLALVDNKIPGWEARIYTTMTRGKRFGFLVPTGMTANAIRTAVNRFASICRKINRKNKKTIRALVSSFRVSRAKAFRATGITVRLCLYSPVLNLKNVFRFHIYKVFIMVMPSAGHLIKFIYKALWVLKVKWRITALARLF
jgi:hypothetical protein